LQHPFANLLLTLTFFSRLPLPKAWGEKIGSDARLTDAVAFFPVAGFLIGVLPAITWFISTQFLPVSVAAGLALAVGAVLTGALHEDGLADCADGLGATSDARRALEIMRDSQIGTYGGVSLLLTFGLRWAALASLGAVSGAFALLIAYTASRSAICIAMRFSTYVRKDGLGKSASGELSDLDFWLAISLAVLAGLLLGHWHGLVAVALGFLAAWLFLQYLKNRIGGYTGDGLGAMQQFAEITIMITLTGFWA